MTTKTPKANKYLIIGPSWVGDMVMAQSLFIDIQQRDVGATIDVLAPAWTAALIDRMPQVNQLISVDFQHGQLSLIKRFKLGRQLRRKGYTHAITLPNSIKSALVPAIAKVPIRSGFIGEQRWGLLNDIRRLDKTVLPMTVQRFLALGMPQGAATRTVESIPPPELSVNPDIVRHVMEKYNLNPQGPVLALCPGAEFGASKKWPAKHYAKVARHFSSLGWSVWLLGSDNDVQAAQEIKQLADGHGELLAGKTSLPEAIDLLSQARLVVSNDSGLMHIAAALQTPLIAVYGSTDPSHTPPLSENHYIARLGLECSPCFKRECPLQHLDCLVQLSPELVIQQAERLLH